jgi:hypothetical protein
MTNLKQLGVVCVAAGAGALLGIGLGEWMGSVVRDAVVGAVLGPVVAFAGMAVYLYLGDSAKPEDW